MIDVMALCKEGWYIIDNLIVHIVPMSDDKLKGTEWTWFSVPDDFWDLIGEGE